MFVAPNRLALTEFVEPWLAGLTNQGREPTTLRGYGTIERHVVPSLGSLPLQDLRPTDLDALYAALLRGGLSMTSVHHVHAVVSKLLHDTERKGLVNRNVARLANAPPLTTARARGPEMALGTPAELSTFLVSIESNRIEACSGCWR